MLPNLVRHFDTTKKTAYSPAPIHLDDDDGEGNDNDEHGDRNRITRVTPVLSSTVWQPTALKWPVLLPVILYTIAVIGGLIFLIKRQETHGAILYMYEARGSMFAATIINYLPIILAIAYSICWGWVDLTIKRLEPWYQLSKDGGSIASQSLSLQYPTEFAPFVPFKAARKGHWTVFISSTIMVAVFWIITPLQGALFSVEQVPTNSWISLNVSGGLVSLEDQNNQMSPGFLITGYATTWLGQTLPGFTNGSYALLPFDNSVVTEDAEANVTYAATLYTTDLDCWPPAAVSLDSGSTDALSTPIFDDGKGCLTSPIELHSYDANGSFAAIYRGYYDNGGSEPGLSGCPQNASHRFLGLWYRVNNSKIDFSDPTQGCALFCEPSYFKQKVNATVSARSKAVRSYVPLANREQLPDAEFNRTLFEYIIWNGISTTFATSQQSEAPRHDIPEESFLYQDSQLGAWGLNSIQPVESMVGFAVGATKEVPDAYLRPEVLSRSYLAAHRLLFSLAIQRIAATPQPMTDGTTSTIGHLYFRQEATVMSTAIAYILASTFAIVITLTSYLLLSLSQRECHLATDPDSLRGICSNATDSQLYKVAAEAAIRNFSTKGDQLLSKERFTLQRKNQMSGCSGEIIRLHTDRSFLDDNNSDHNAKNNDSKNIPAVPNPIELGFLGQSLFITSLVLFTSALVVSFILLEVHDGLPFVPSSNFVQQILLSYIPIVAATIIEPFWTLITRHACVLQPFFKMAVRPTKSKFCLDLQYASLPPQLVSVLALKNCDYMLTALGIATLAANVLSIAMSGMFYIQPSEVRTGAVAGPLKNAQFNGTRMVPNVGLNYQYEPFYLVQTSIENKTPLPPFLDTSSYYMPVAIPASNNSTRGFLVNTTGVGLQMDCRDLSGSATKLDFNNSASYVAITAEITDENGQIFECGARGFITVGKYYSPDTDMSNINGDPSGRKAAECVGHMAAIGNQNSSAHDAFCASRILYGWLRTNISLSTSSNTTLRKRSSSIADVTALSVDSTFIACRPQVITAPYTLNISITGIVQEARLIGPQSTPIEPSKPNGSFEPLVGDLITLFQPGFPRYFSYHNDTITSDWTNYLIKKSTNSTDFLDAYKPPPDPRTAIKYVSDIFARAFAAQVYLKRDFLLDYNNTSKATAISDIAQEIKTIHKVYISKPMFWMAITVLAWDIVVAVSFYWTIPKPFLRYQPTSILGILALFEGSRAMQEFVNESSTKRGKDNTVAASPESIERQESLYAFGLFSGTDGKSRIGIDYFPYATPIWMKAKKRKPWTLSL